MKDKKKKGKLFIFAAPSGAGKTSLLYATLEQLQKNIAIERVVTYTTRNPRHNETNGIDYHFVSQDDFKEKKLNGFFIETNEYNGNLYGSPKSLFSDLEIGKSYAMTADINGVQSLNEYDSKNVVNIWIMPPSLSILEERLRSRKTETDKAIKQRMSIAQQEISQAANTHFHHKVINDDFDVAVQKLCKIILYELA